MKMAEVTIGGRYTAKVSGKLVTVRVLEINKRFVFGKQRTVIRAINESSGREIGIRSAQRLRSVAL